MRHRLIVFSFAATVSASLTGCGVREIPSPAERPLSVETVLIKREIVCDVVDLMGTVSAEPDRSARVTCVVPGVLDKVFPKVGDAVHKGDIVATLQNSLQKAQVRQNKASLMQAQANLQKSTNGSRPQEIEQAQAAVDAAKANAINATANKNRLQKLFEDQVTAGRDLDLAIDQERVALAQLRSAKAALALAEKGPRKEDRDATAAQAEQAAGMFDQAKANLAFTQLRSPITGVVAERYLDAGEQASPATPVLLVVDPTVVMVQVNLPVGYTDEIRRGQDVALVPPDKGKALTGKVERIGVKLDALTNTIPVQVGVPNPDLRLKLGMVVTARIQKGQHETLVVPISALIGSASDPAHPVLNVVRNGKSVTVSVELGVVNSEIAEIKAGVTPGERVITNVGYKLPDGTVVAPR